MSGCRVDFVPLLERSSYFSKGLQYPFRFDIFSLPNLMHQRWDSVFGGISFFSQLRFFITFMDGCQNQVWITLMPELTKVSTLWTVWLKSSRVVLLRFVSLGDIMLPIGNPLHSTDIHQTHSQPEVGTGVPDQSGSFRS